MKSSTLTRTLSLVLLFSVVSSSHGERFSRQRQAREAQVLEHGFGSAGSAEVTIRLEPVEGRLRRGRRRGSRTVDLADYARAGELVTTRELRLGPFIDGPVRIPPGRYRLSLSPHGPEGLPTLVLQADTGLRLRLLLPRGSRPSVAPRRLRGESLAVDGSETWPVLLHMPTVTAMVVLAVAPSDSRRRRQTRSQSIHEAMQDRALKQGVLRGVQSQEASRPD